LNNFYQAVQGGVQRILVLIAFLAFIATLPKDSPQFAAGLYGGTSTSSVNYPADNRARAFVQSRERLRSVDVMWSQRARASLSVNGVLLRSVTLLCPVLSSIEINGWKMSSLPGVDSHIKL
jgi:hypothetical protein